MRRLLPPGIRLSEFILLVSRVCAPVPATPVGCSTLREATFGVSRSSLEAASGIWVPREGDRILGGHREQELQGRTSCDPHRSCLGPGTAPRAPRALGTRLLKKERRSVVATG